MLNYKNQKLGFPELLGLFCLLFIFILFLFPLFNGKTLFTRDFSFVTYPVKFYLAQSFKEGIIPFWTPYYQSGTSFLGEFHTGVFYPPSILFFLPDFSIAINAFYLFHFFILTFPCYFIARSWNSSTFGSFCTACTAFLGGISISSVLLSNIFYSLAWFPLVFLMFHHWMRTGAGKYLFYGVFSLVCQTLGACPEVCVFTVILIFLHSVIVVPSEEKLSDFKTRSWAIGIFVILALGISALQLIPTYNLIDLSFRQGGWSYKGHSNWSMGFEKLSTFILPRDYGEYILGENRFDSIGFFSTAYMGIFAANFVFMAFMFRDSKAIRFWLLVFFVGVFFSLGGNNFFYEYIYKLNPFLRVFRYPEKYFVVSAIASIFLVGLVFDKLMESTKKKSLNLKGVLFLNFLTMVLIGWFWFENNFTKPIPPLFFISVFSLLIILTYFEKSKIKILQTFLPLMLVLDLVFSNFNLLPLVDQKVYEKEPVLLSKIKKEGGKFRLYSGNLENKFKVTVFPPSFNVLSGTISQFEYLVPYLGMKYEVENVKGIPGIGMGLRDTGLWYELLVKSSPERRLRILKRSNVKFAIDWDTKTVFSGNSPIMTPDHLKVFEDALPRAFLVPKMQLGKDPLLLNTYYSEEFDPLQTVLLSEPVEFQETPNFDGEVESIKYSPNHVTIHTNQQGNGFLVLLDSYFPGWTVTVDGEERKILKANHFYRAVQLGPGRHTLEFDFYPVGFTEGLIVSGISFVILILLTLFWRPFRKNKVHPPAQQSPSTLSPKNPDPVVTQPS